MKKKVNDARTHAIFGSHLAKVRANNGCVLAVVQCARISTRSEILFACEIINFVNECSGRHYGANTPLFLKRPSKPVPAGGGEAVVLGGGCAGDVVVVIGREVVVGGGGGG